MKMQAPNLLFLPADSSRAAGSGFWLALGMIPAYCYDICRNNCRFVLRSEPLSCEALPSFGFGMQIDLGGY